MRQHGTATKYPGVHKVKEGVFRVRAKVVDPRTGKPKEVDKLLTGVSAQQAAKVRTELLQELKAGPDAGRDRLRVGEYARLWMESKAAVLDDRTAKHYAEALDLHVLPMLGDFYYDALRPADVQGWVNTQFKPRGPEGERYAVVTVHGWFRVLRTMTRDAVVQLDLPRDPTVRITFPDAEAPREVNALTPAELASFLDAMRAKYPKNYALTVTLAFTGLRFCHASALKWEDMDEARAVLAIVRKNSRGKVGPVSRKKRAPREIPIVPELAAILGEHRRVLETAKAPGLEEGWMFPSDIGTLRLAGSLWKAWQGCLKAAGISQRFTVHGLRRTFNDLARRAGVDAVVTRSLTGHVTERMREHYSTVGLDEQEAALAGVLRLVPRTVATKVGTPVAKPSGPDEGSSEETVGTAVEVGTEVGTETANENGHRVGGRNH